MPQGVSGDLFWFKQLSKLCAIKLRKFLQR